MRYNPSNYSRTWGSTVGPGAHGKRAKHLDTVYSIIPPPRLGSEGSTSCKPEFSDLQGKPDAFVLIAMPLLG